MLETLNLKKSLSKTAYAHQMPDLQERMRRLQYRLQDAKIPVIICLEGWNCAGKGRVIKKLMEKLDPRLFRVHPGTPPTPLEQRYHFLWRYQVELPNDGEISLFDHSWYGRVLVERCNKLVAEHQWREAYQQINEFEQWLVEDRQIVLKFWMHISGAQQKKRFHECLCDPLLKWKITKEYRRQHKHYDQWTDAVEDMLAKTNTTHAPWTVVEANDLRHARVRVFEVLVQRCEEALTRAEAATPAEKAKAAHA
jgi:AMP-polyphosphate phosphotransferase